MFETLLFEVEDGIAVITLNRPDKLNAFTRKMASELIAAFDLTDADDAVRAVIVTGAGRAFCAGADLSEGKKSFDYEARYGEAPAQGVPRDIGGTVTLRLFDSLKPVIAAINGAAVGVGATMPLAMDFRMASDSARFGFVFARRGIVPEAASSWFLPRIVGMSTALEWAYSGRLVDAPEALAGRLVRSVHKPEDLLAAAKQFARDLVAHTAPVSVALTRQMMWKMLGASHPMEAHRLDSRLVQARGTSGDAREGVASFLEKRPAAYPDRVSTDMPEHYPWWPELGFDEEPKP